MAGIWWEWWGKLSVGIWSQEVVVQLWEIPILKDPCVSTATMCPSQPAPRQVIFVSNFSKTRVGREVNNNIYNIKNLLTAISLNQNPWVLLFISRIRFDRN